MTEQAHTQVRDKEANVYASHEDFHTIVTFNFSSPTAKHSSMMSGGTLLLKSIASLKRH
jgi:hypothetical protein